MALLLEPNKNQPDLDEDSILKVDTLHRFGLWFRLDFRHRCVANSHNAKISSAEYLGHRTLALQSRSIGRRNHLP